MGVTADDAICKQLVIDLRKVGGETMDDAADTYERFHGRVVLDPHWGGDTGSSTKDTVKLGTGVSETGVGGVVQGGEGDRLILAVHEAAHLRGVGDEYSGPDASINAENLKLLEQRAFRALKSLNYSAPLFYFKLNSAGFPVQFYRPPPPTGGK